MANKTMKKTCTKCGLAVVGIQAVRNKFGTSMRRGVEVPRSYCRPCNREYERNRRANASNKQVADVDSLIETAKQAAETVEKTVGITNYRSTHEMSETVGIIRFNSDELANMLKHLEASGAMEIGVGIKAI